MPTTIQIRLLGNTEINAHAAIAALRDAVGTRPIAQGSPPQGRDQAASANAHWLAYRASQFENAALVSATDVTTRRRRKGGAR